MTESFDTKGLPDALLHDLGVTEPSEIDLDVLAWRVGATVRRHRLRDCEARVTGFNDRAIITVTDNVAPTRQRFSIAHELGHWYHHRGYALTCRSVEIGSADAARNDAERVADRYAADLLMPAYLFHARLKAAKASDWTGVRAVAKEFCVSPLAAAIRIIESDRYPLLLVCHDAQGRRWFKAANSLQGRCFPRPDLDSDTPAFALLYGHREQQKPCSSPGLTWFERGLASQIPVQEHSMSDGNSIYTLLLLNTKDLDRRASR